MTNEKMPPWIYSQHPEIQKNIKIITNIAGNLLVGENLEILRILNDNR